MVTDKQTRADRSGGAVISAQERYVPLWRAFRYLLSVLPTAVVFALLVVLFWWGHHHRWTMPRWAQIVGQEEAQTDDWCAEHGVPESVCVECQPEQFPPPPSFGWCSEHGIPDCPLEHPEVAQLATVTPPTDRERARVRRALELKERPVNHPECQLRRRRLQFASQEAFARSGIELAVVQRGPVVEALEASGEVTYDPTRVTRVAARTPATVRHVYRSLGDQVARGEILALLDAAEVGRSKAELVQALVQVQLRKAQLERLRSTPTLSTKQQLQEAEAALHEAQARVLLAQQSLINLGLVVPQELLQDRSPDAVMALLKLAGLPPALASSLDPRTISTNLLPVAAPIEGTIIAREISQGETVESTRTLFVVADTSHMWLNLNVRAEDAADVHIGQRVFFRPDGSKEEFTGTLFWIDTSLDEKTRTLKVRAQLDNRHGCLRDHMFGQGRILLRHDENATLVPNEAVHWEGCCFVVFVRDRDWESLHGARVFHVRKVRPGAVSGPRREIIAGLLPGEVVAARGSTILLAQLLRHKMGAG